jgi:phosphopantetheinyl transferase
MPIFFQQDIDTHTRLGVWKIEEGEDFFMQWVQPQHDVRHPHKRKQHLAGRYLLKYLFPSFPMELIRIADTRKPYLEDEAYHFSISHCGDYAAVIVSQTIRVGVDIEQVTTKLRKIRYKFLHEEELRFPDPLPVDKELECLTVLWCTKEAMFKWWGHGGVDFSEMLRIHAIRETEGIVQTSFVRNEMRVPLTVHYLSFSGMVLCWVTSLR